MPRELEKEPVRVTTMEARQGALQAVLAMKDELVALKPEEFLRILQTGIAKDTNYCCAGCAPAYSPK